MQNKTLPGYVLLGEVLGRNIPSEKVADTMGIGLDQLMDIYAGIQPITTDIACGLEMALGTDAEYWINLQNDFDMSI